MSGYTQRVTRMAVVHDSDPSFISMGSIHISIDDDGGGEYVVVKQFTDSPPDDGIDIIPEEWPVLRDAIDKMVAACIVEEPPRLGPSEFVPKDN